MEQRSTSSSSTDPSTGSADARLVIGRIGRAHGLRGDVTVSLLTNRPERTATGSELWAGDRRLAIEQARQDGDRWIVRFEGVATREAAEGLRAAELTADPLEGDDGALWVDDLIGLRLHDGGVDRGRITAVQANPASDLLVLDTGSLVPSGFVVGVDDGVVLTECPAGLFELP